MAVSISMSLPDDLYQWLDSLSKDTGKSIQKIIREMLYEMKMLKEDKIDELLVRMEILLKKLNKQL